MTKLVKLNMLAAVGLAIVVSSCGTSNNVVSGGIFTKRKHTKGYHVNLPSKFKGTKANTELDDKEVMAVQELEEKVIQYQERNFESINDIIESSDFKHSEITQGVSLEANTIENAKNKENTKTLIINKTKSNFPLTIKQKTEHKKQMKATASPEGDGKSQVVALILVLLLGILGIHRFYLGYPGIGILMLLTGGLCGILALIDLILIITGDLKPKNSDYSEKL